MAKKPAQKYVIVSVPDRKLLGYSWAVSAAQAKNNWLFRSGGIQLSCVKYGVAAMLHSDYLQELKEKNTPPAKKPKNQIILAAEPKPAAPKKNSEQLSFAL
ncbi:MAG: hypothetical protein WC310_04555 [Patescibacteria group bacterium]|jgi:hypothetical protein